MDEFSSDVAFSDSVKAVQTELGSRDAMQRMAETRDFNRAVSDDLAAFLAQRDSFYLATASAAGQPYIQHRGGPAGFLKVLDAFTLAFADFAGNRQYVTLGNLRENDRVALFLMDYAGRQRIKIWGRARVVEDDAQLLERLYEARYTGEAQRAIVINVSAWDVNCQQHITVRHDEATIARAMQKVLRENEALRAEVARLRGTGL